MMKKVTIGASIIEDDPAVRRLLGEWISRAKGFRCVSQHASAASALMQLPAEKPNLVLVDINLPDLNGIQCVTRLKPLMPDTQFIMLTVYEDADHIFSALAAGAVGYLLKETSREELIAALREVHAGGAPMTSYIARRVVLSFQRPKSEPVGENLTGREREVLGLLAQGYLYKEIADALDISMPTVSTYIRRIYDKLHVNSRGRAVAKFTQTTLSTLPSMPTPPAARG
ncbi:MAG TPA: response regulator transcription factor [Candidatus Acidoferrum sp.]|nr:response regulator transcription factor [Candidatus Acidoferrum sp.]